jgi:pilus assembly protein CpaE
VLLEPEVTGLRNACSLRALAHGIVGSNRVFTVLNRADRSGGLSLPIIRKGLGTAPDLVIPDLGKRMTEAVNLGVPALHKVPALRRHLAPLVREIAGIRPGRSQSWLKKWFPK